MTQPTDYWLKEPNCYICGRKRSKCREMRDKEIRNRVPDPHEFESAEQAERNASHKQIPAKIRAAIPEASHLSDAPYLPADLAVETQARQETEQEPADA